MRKQYIEIWYLVRWRLVADERSQLLGSLLQRSVASCSCALVAAMLRASCVSRRSRKSSECLQCVLIAAGVLRNSITRSYFICGSLNVLTRVLPRLTSVFVADFSLRVETHLCHATQPDEIWYAKISTQDNKITRYAVIKNILKKAACSKSF